MLLLSHLEPSETKISSALMAQPRAWKIVGGNRLTQPEVALFRPVSHGSSRRPHRVDGLLHRFAAGGRQRLVTSPMPRRIREASGLAAEKSLHPASDLGKEIARLELSGNWN